jgi:hypothetical protein
MAIFFGLWLKIIFSEARSFTTHPGMQRRHTVRVFLSMVLTSRLRVDLSTQDIEDFEHASGGSNGAPYTQRDNRGSTTPPETGPSPAHFSRSGLPSTPSILQREEEYTPPYNTWGAEWSSQPGELSRTKFHGQYPSMDTTRPSQYEAPYPHPSQVQHSFGSQRSENSWVGESSRPSGRDPGSNPSVGATGPYPCCQPTGSLPYGVCFSPSLHQKF